MFVRGRIAGGGTGGELLEIAGIREAFIEVAAVDSQGNGLLCDVSVKIGPGSGKVFYRIQPYAQVDLQYSADTAVKVAARMAGIDLSNIDVSFEIKAPARIIGGQSAGVAMTIITYAAIENRRIRDDVVVTGEIRPDGSIGGVGEVIAKARAVAEAGKKLFLVPPGQSRVVTYRQVIDRGPFMWRVTYEPVIVDLNEYAEQQGWDLEIREVSTAWEVARLMLK